MVTSNILQKCLFFLFIFHYAMGLVRSTKIVYMYRKNTASCFGLSKNCSTQLRDCLWILPKEHHRRFWRDMRIAHVTLFPGTTIRPKNISDGAVRFGPTGLPVEVRFRAGPRWSAPFGLQQWRAELPTATGVLQHFSPALHLTNSAGFATCWPGRPLTNATVPRGSWKIRFNLPFRSLYQKPTDFPNVLSWFAVAILFVVMVFWVNAVWVNDAVHNGVLVASGQCWLFVHCWWCHVLSWTSGKHTRLVFMQ